MHINISQLSMNVFINIKKRANKDILDRKSHRPKRMVIFGWLIKKKTPKVVKR